VSRADQGYGDGRRALTSTEARRLLDAIAEGKLGPVDDPELVALERKLKVTVGVSTEVEKRPRP
jgi:hypothetical protein